jgi:hypothetical protein
MLGKTGGAAVGLMIRGCVTDVYCYNPEVDCDNTTQHHDNTTPLESEDDDNHRNKNSQSAE